MSEQDEPTGAWTPDPDATQQVPATPADPGPAPTPTGSSDAVPGGGYDPTPTPPAGIYVPPPDDTAAAEPDEDPPGEYSVFCGFRVLVGCEPASSVVAVLPTMMAPAALASATQVASIFAILSA